MSGKKTVLRVVSEGSIFDRSPADYPVYLARASERDYRDFPAFHKILHGGILYFLHGVSKPNVEKNLSGFSHGANQDR